LYLTLEYTLQEMEAKKKAKRQRRTSSDGQSAYPVSMVSICGKSDCPFKKPGDAKRAGL